MYKRFRKIAAVVMAAAIMLQSGASAIAEEVQTQAATEAQTQAATEAQTQAATEAQTQAATEAQTQAATEAQTQAATEAQTQAVTEAQTQAATEAQTQAATEAQTQAATEAQTQAATETQTQAATEAQTQANTEQDETAGAKKKKKKEKTEETERSGRKNDGNKMKSSDLVSGLGAALSYLFAAETVEGPEDAWDGQAVAQGAEGKSVVSALESFSLKLANAKSSADVKVVNVYADQSGKLDTAQLKKAFDSETVDVTKKYCVVNIIADSADQALSFSGYGMVLSGGAVSYEDASQPGDILYNFAAMDGDEFTGYKGTLTLSNGSGLQGTFLAPQAAVNVQSDLSGAVYADSINVADTVSELMRIVFVNGSAETEPEESETQVTEVETEPEESETQVTEVETEPEESETQVTEVETEPEEIETQVTDVQTEPEESETQVTDVQTEPEESETQVTEVETEPEESETQVTEVETEPEIQIDTEELTDGWQPETVESTSESDTEGSEAAFTDDTAEVLFDTAEEQATDAVYYSEEPVSLQVALQDADGTVTETGTVSVKTAVNILDSENNVLYAKDSVMAEKQCALGSTANIVGALQKGGSYYLDVTVPEGYSNVPRIYFSIDAEGKAAIGSGTSGASLTGNALTITLYKEAPKGSVKLTVTKETEEGEPITSAAFVIKDADTKKILRDENGNPKYYISYTGSPFILSGLAAGSYILSQVRTEDGYQIAEDQKITVPAADASAVDVKVTNQQVTGDKSVTVSAQALYNGVILNAEPGMTAEFWIALFKEDGSTRLSEPKKLTYAADSQSSGTVSFTGLAAGSYLLAATDEYGEVLSGQTYQLDTVSQTVTVSEADAEKQAVLKYNYGTYPTGDFYYFAQLSLTKNVLGKDGKALATAETFYLNLLDASQKTPENLYSVNADGSVGAQVTVFPLAFAMNKSSTLTQSYYLKMTTADAVYSLSETDASGQTVAGTDFAYAVTAPAEVTVSCGEGTAAGVQKVTEAVVENKLNASKVLLRVVDESGNHLDGATLILKNSKGNVISVNGTVTYSSKTSDIVLENLLTDGNTYYLSEISAKSGYTPAEDVKFTVKRGGVTEVVLVNKKEAATGYSLTATKTVYAGQYQVYAQDTASGTYASEGRYTFYAALFSDSACTKKVSNVQKITVSGLSGTTTFSNLKAGATYYIAETNQYGIAGKAVGSPTIQYANNGKVQMTSKSQTTTIQNVYSSLPRGYRYTGTLTVTKRVTDSSGAAKKVTSTFYAGIYRKADYSDTPTIVKLELNNASSASVKRRILLSGSNDVVYYIAEVDAQGNRITDSSSFDYTVSVDQPQLTVSKSADKTVTITNKEKSTSSKVTLYITKRVYEGTSLKAVNETFYAGLFKDAGFTQLYTKPVALTLKNKSELTLKLSLNLGTASSANIYIAEVDANGKVISDQEGFGYDIKLVNSTAAFTPERSEVQTILINSVYGTTTTDGWNSILSDSGNYLGGSDYISDNGVASAGTSDPVQTGDDTAVLPYLVLLAAAFVVLTGFGFRRIRVRR